ncbi:eukaryotic translation initiation factor 4E type 1B-like protein [Dinothrombium tinctorium]|uniref:Eukaryotic translation initiation factor 4E type 1B-like protein n=1 Tax=Dinothrombium tinctorium TaxID=1965070 RepID=A0A443R8K9_9ACAR|nr:eukaryotic translation initiation factor 4E type 1B-like protein [Dinothrombium tinctorium]
METSKQLLKKDWVLYHYRPNTTRKTFSSLNDAYRQFWESFHFIAKFSSVENFLALDGQQKRVSNLTHGNDCYVFKHDIPIDWTHPRNIEGGRWIFKYDTTISGSQLDNIFYQSVLCLVSEDCWNEREKICGIAIHIRNKMNKICVWTSDHKNPDEIIKIGKVFKEKIGYTETATYEVHREAQRELRPQPAYSI